MRAPQDIRLLSHVLGYGIGLALIAGSTAGLAWAAEGTSDASGGLLDSPTGQLAGLLGPAATLAGLGRTFVMRLSSDLEALQKDVRNLDDSVRACRQELGERLDETAQSNEEATRKAQETVCDQLRRLQDTKSEAPRQTESPLSVEGPSTAAPLLPMTLLRLQDRLDQVERELAYLQGVQGIRPRRRK